MKKYVLPKDYPELDFGKMNIFLLEGGDRVLPPMSPKSSEDAERYLHQLGVNVMTKSLVKDYDGNTVSLADGKSIPSTLVIWAAGIKGNVPEGVDKSLIVRGNRIKVDRHNRIPGFENLFAIGDLAYMETPGFPNGHPQVAPVAIQQADNLADYLKRIERKSTRFYEFEYNDKGAMATIGRNKAVVDIPKPKVHLNGFIAWLIWMGLHLFLILGVKNRLFVFMNWIYNYFTYDQSLRLIFKVFYRPKLPVDPIKQEQANPQRQTQTA
jgi:NADH:ubiquinone reductase (H+-translocating)